VDVAQAGDLWGVPAEAEDAVGIKFVGVDARVLGVDMDDAVAKFTSGSDIVDVLPDEVRRIEVEA